jgi:protein phosphatase
MNLIDFNKDVYSVSDVGLVRQANEDNCYAAETPNGFLFVVCDGMGGHVGGARASAIAVNSIVNFFTKEHYAVIGQALEDALNFANCQILDVAAKQPELKGMGTTACIVLLRDEKAYFAHIGDSRIYFYCNKQQQLHRLTKDHSVVQGLVDQGVITEAEAEHHPNKNRILKTLGIKKDIQPDVCQMPVLPAKGDVFLICSDGLSGMVNDELLLHVLEQKGSLQEKGGNMLIFAKQAGGTDNITIQLIHISNSPHACSTFISKNSSYTVSTARSKNSGNKLLIALIAMFSVIVICGIILLINPFQEKEKIIPTTTVNETPQKKAWEREVEQRGYTNTRVINGWKIFSDSKKTKGKEIDAVVVNEKTESYFVGKINIETEMYFEKIDGIEYDKNGKPKE